MADIIDKWFILQLRREFWIVGSQKQSLLQSMLFFIMFVMFFPMAIPYDEHIFHTIFPGIVWVSAIFAVFLASERFYTQDIQYGCLEQWLVGQHSLLGYVGIKMLVHGLILLLAMLFISPLLIIIYHLSALEWYALVLSLIAGMPAVVGMCALVAAFGAYGQDSSLVMLLILFPLILPMIMLGSSVMVMAGLGMNWLGVLALCMALSLTTLLILPYAAAYLLKSCLERGL